MTRRHRQNPGTVVKPFVDMKGGGRTACPTHELVIIAIAVRSQ